MRITFFLLLSIYSFFGISQNDTTVLNKKKLYTVYGIQSSSYAVSLIGLNELWYKNSDRTKFHWFNDNNEWLQMDKLGHLYSTFQLTRINTAAFTLAGLDTKKAAIRSAIVSWFMVSSIEFLDGFASDYGASTGDLAANSIGASIALGQYLAWSEIRIQMKYSFHSTPYAQERKELLGENALQEPFKDYNGQTYWLSGNISDLTKSRKVPKFINIALGYGAEEMVSADRNVNKALGYAPYRKYFFSLDLDFEKLRGRKKGVNTLLFFLNTIKLPFPTLEYSKHGLKFHPIYF